MSRYQEAPRRVTLASEINQCFDRLRSEGRKIHIAHDDGVFHVGRARMAAAGTVFFAFDPVLSGRSEGYRGGSSLEVPQAERMLLGIKRGDMAYWTWDTHGEMFALSIVD